MAFDLYSNGLAEISFQYFPPYSYLHLSLMATLTQLSSR